MKTKLTALFLSLVMLVSVVSILSTVPVGALTEGDWIPKRSAKDYNEENADSYKPASGYYYDNEGFHTVKPDTTGISVFTNVVTREAYDLKHNNDTKNGHVLSMKFRIDDYSYGGENGADHWIAVSIKDRQEVEHGNTDLGDGLIVLNRGNGDGNATCLPHLDNAGRFDNVATVGIQAELDSQGREIYTFTLDYVNGEWIFAMNGYTFNTMTVNGTGVSLTDVFNSFETCAGYVAVTLHASVKGGSGAFTILEFNGEVPFGEDRADSEENINSFADIADPSTVPANKPAIIWDSTMTSVSRLTGGMADFSINEVDKTVIMKATGLNPSINFNPKNSVSYDGKDFPCFAMLTRNVADAPQEAGFSLWYAAGDVMSADENHVATGLYYDDVDALPDGVSVDVGDWNLTIYVLDPEVDDFTGRINALRVDLAGFDISDNEACTLKIGFLAMFRNAEEAAAYAEAYVKGLAVDPDDTHEETKAETTTDAGNTTTAAEEATTVAGSDKAEATTGSETKKTETTTDAEKSSGCGSVITGFSVIAVITLGAFAIRKKD